MISKKNILLLVPDGTGIKNYLYSSVFKHADASLHLYHNFDGDTLTELKNHISLDSTLEIPAYKESVKEKFLRELIHLARIQYNAKKAENPSILSFFKSKKGSVKLIFFYKVVQLLATTITTYQGILKLEKKYQKALRKNPLYPQVSEQLQTLQPDVLFCTHQRALKAPVVFAAARDLGIKTATVIYSWDNIPKARLALQADLYLVWSRYMKKELQFFYPEIASEGIKVTGTPQFEFYKDESNIIPKTEFYSSYGLSESKKIVCFSGDDVLTSPHDPQYLDDIASAIVSEGMEDRIQIVFRRCPVDVSGRYDWVLQKFPKLIIDMPPLWNFNSDLWSAVYPTYQDISLLVSLAYYADAVVNVGSTMAFDFGMFGKPCIFINYDTVPDRHWSVKRIYAYQHFRSMPSKDAVYWLSDKENIIAILTRAIDTPATAIAQWFDVVVEDAERASQQILKSIV
ncbi:hypothetical protein ACFQO1_04195 [Jejudonia soesokkakensis]|uniref:Diacylglycerol glucosyltransferase N-terminal domain-containing protein n=1 Tax=Jejudonia soesokkakensis TaxID=1323432 RepID=A0ABW2MT44_9FLAO